MTCTDRIKVPEGCVRRAQALGITNEVVIYYTLKTINVEGYFKRGSGVLDVASKLGISERTVRRWIKTQLALGLMYKERGGYGMVNYDRLFEALGYTGTKGKKLFKIKSKHTNSKEELITAITKAEVQHNMDKQRYMIGRKLRPKDRPDNLSVNTTITLSCKGVSSLLGYSKTTGYRLEQQLVGQYPHTVIIDRHAEVVRVLHPYFDAGYKIPKGCYINDGVVLRNSSNRIYIY